MAKETRLAAPRTPASTLPGDLPIRQSTLFVGPCGGGKTIAMAEAVHRLLRDDADTQVFMASEGPSGSLQALQAVTAWRVTPDGDGLEQAGQAVEAMNDVIDLRAQHYAPESLPPLVMVVDDCLEELLGVEALANGIENVVRRGRSLGVLVYATSQSLWLPWVCMALPWGFQVVRCEYPGPPRLLT